MLSDIFELVFAIMFSASIGSNIWLWMERDTLVNKHNKLCEYVDKIECRLSETESLAEATDRTLTKMKVDAFSLN